MEATKVDESKLESSENVPEETMESESETEVLPDPEIPEEVQTGEGDSGDEEYEGPLTITDRLNVPVERMDRVGFQKFMLEYANTQNYTKDGLNYGYADLAYKDGIKIDDSAARINGMGNIGYLAWVYRNTFGICDPDFTNPIRIYEKSPKLEVQDLEVGDLALYSETEEGNFYGICIGWEGEDPVFSIMDAGWSSIFPFGCNRLCYLQSEKNLYLEESQPVDFRYFCRPELPWLSDTPGADLNGQIFHTDYSKYFDGSIDIGETGQTIEGTKEVE